MSDESLGPVAGGVQDVRFERPGDLQQRIKLVLPMANDEQRSLLMSALGKKSSGNLTLDERWALRDLEAERAR